MEDICSFTLAKSRKWAGNSARVAVQWLLMSALRLFVAGKGEHGTAIAPILRRPDRPGFSFIAFNEESSW
jgi:hypothetical protein